jgi:hypothetical protein
MNVTRALANYLQSISVGTFGTDIFISRAPSSDKVPDSIFWLKATGGSLLKKAVNGSSQRNYVIEIYHRDVNTESVYETLQGLGEDLTCAGCVTLESYDVVEIVTNGPWTDQDLDNEERTVGLLQATITIMEEC